MFSIDELEALVLGARWVRGQGDAALARIAAATPRDLRDDTAETSLWVPLGDQHVGPVREAIRYQHRLRIGYCDERGQPSQRMVWPFALAFFEGKRRLAAWCELRAGFRHFRIDRIATVETTRERYPARRHELLASWRREHNIRPDS